jgi:hypothetical protein
MLAILFPFIWIVVVLVWAFTFDQDRYDRWTEKYGPDDEWRGRRVLPKMLHNWQEKVELKRGLYSTEQLYLIHKTFEIQYAIDHIHQEAWTWALETPSTEDIDDGWTLDD